MLLHRRTAVVVLAALLLVSVYRFCSVGSGYGVPVWVRGDRNGDGEAMNGTLGFEKVFVINLPSRRDRRDSMALAGVVSNLNFTFIRALTGENAVLPAPLALGNAAEDRTATDFSHSASTGARGSWGSHLSALQSIVDLKLGSALVLEDDVDWDVRLKAQMRTFARASRTWLAIEQRKRPKAGPLLSSVSNIRGAIKTDVEGDAIALPPHVPLIDGGSRARSASPYGDNWDVLWLGHCGADLPTAQREARSRTPDSFSSSSSALKITIANDTTVPAPKHLQPHPFALLDALADAYPAHTRVVHASRGNVCSLAYAVSQRGARKLLRRFSEDGFVAQWDLMLRDYCSGEDEEQSRGMEQGRKDRESLICLTVQPPLISHRYETGGGASVSDIRGQGGGFAREKMGTPYIRLSVQANLDRLLAGYPEERLVDQLPDHGSALW
ncbi:hypothetical protein F5B22DRAFT_597282 [Xylaria bambusicola]|uniref:uncharacterized protein n=1 Tax=Xylaria bambusicola TaxID=326684 RepID=UPI002008DDDF|nr:uncharacterized protein F5B22DRAFT_597282 [Xylaria bambusicola]KAI0521028.1 hypothetical protein F5B22DRAFT_597282 [Xylaria bambusicola]